MSHYTQRQFVGWVSELFPQFFEKSRVLEVGSLDINGSVRRFFSDCQYTGLDVGKGPGVDVVCGGQDYDAPSGSFDVVCSFEAMEHNPYWKETFANMARLVRPGGLAVMSCATLGRPEHGTTRSNPSDSPLTNEIGWDYYRNLSSRDFEQSFDIADLFSQSFFAHYYHGSDLFFVGFRSGAKPPANAKRSMALMKFRYFLRNAFDARARRTMLGIKLGRITQ